MNAREMNDFKNFMMERNVYLMFATNYRQAKLMANPDTLELYLERAKVENVIPCAFVYPRGKYGKDFWLSINEEWIAWEEARRMARDSVGQLERMGLDVIMLHDRKGATPMRYDECSLSMGKSYTLRLNLRHSELVLKAMADKLLLTRSRATGDVVLMYNRMKGIDVTCKRSGKERQYVVANNRELVCHLVNLLELNADADYCKLHITVLKETPGMVMFKLEKIFNA